MNQQPVRANQNMGANFYAILASGFLSGLAIMIETHRLALAMVAYFASGMVAYSVREISWAIRSLKDTD